MSEKNSEKEKLIQELIKTFDEVIDYAMYMKMVTRYEGGKKPNLLLDACRLIVKLKGSGLFEKEKAK